MSGKKEVKCYGGDNVIHTYKTHKDGSPSKYMSDFFCEHGWKPMIKLFAIILIIFLLTKQISNNYELKTVGNQWDQKQIIYPNNPATEITFGNSISISNNIMAIGSPSNFYNSHPGRAYVFEKQNYNWIQTAQLPNNNNENNDRFGYSISISQDSSVIVVGVPEATVSGNVKQGKAYVFTKSGNEWIQTKELTASDGQAGDCFGYSVSISERVILIGSPYATVNGNSEQGKVYVWEGNDDGTIWQEKPTLTATNGQANDQFGESLSISKDSSLIVIKSGQSSSEQFTAHIFQSNGTYWNEEENFTVNGREEYGDCGGAVSISEDATTFVMGVSGNSNFQGKAYVFHYNGSNWNNQTIIPNNPSGKCCFGLSVSISQNNLLVGDPGSDSNGNTTYLFQNNGSGWNQEKQWFPQNPVDGFGEAVSISGDISAVGSPLLNYDGFDSVGGVYIYEFVYDQVNLLNCSSLFSSFDCYWNEILPITSDIEYQINYNYINNEQWETIQSPILIDNIFFQIFNSSIYPNITGNVYYNIQIRICNSSSQICGESSGSCSLTTRIDSVKNFTVESLTTTSVMISWNPPNVPIINSIPKLDHYLLFYQKQDSNETKNVSISNSSTSYELTELDSLSNYSISICGCETYECLKNYQGEIVSTTIFTKFGPVLNLQCLISNSFDISCYWNKPNDSINPSYYNFTYQAISENDNGSFDTNLTSQNFTAQYSNQIYQINVSACDSNEICGNISSIQITSEKFGPVLNLQCSISNIYSISCYWDKPNDSINPSYYNFTYQAISKNDNGSFDTNSTSQNFTAQYSNQIYQINVSACDSNEICGNISSIQITSGKFGPVLNLQCLISNSFDISCYWDKPNDSINPSYYNFTYQAISENDNGSFDTNLTSQNFTAQYSNQIYQINVSACDSNQICGDISSIQIGNQLTSSQSSNSKTVIIVCSTVIPVVVIVGIILMIVLIRKKKKKKNKEGEISMDYSVLKDDQ
ncbi:hypothetical protein M0811_06197 [Anaeramoeba ignava]|uniref:Fibronectin type-III domain-containing protein n=1 Tax=Anaeramoeba ignava TaxID=1746090 RepID=A0A9Q0RDX7_ANAIG|nr:hypothetical protein M0811_06197 [Anaeramoeba ignava]